MAEKSGVSRVGRALVWLFLAVERREEGSTESGRGTWVAGRVVFFRLV